MTNVERKHNFSGEHRLPACSCRQLAGNRLGKRVLVNVRCISASCRDEQAGSLCSPDNSAARFVL
ncbi:MAG: hypothetical protein QOH39_280 [Verrucomicrobiota bacterium]|jgi:hypothetical protein